MIHPIGHNPFATRSVRPGALDYIFPTDLRVEDVVERLRAHGWWGEIVGPHGSGKSTLLETLRPKLEAAGRHVVAMTLYQGQRRLPPQGRHQGEWPTPAQLVVDGYEQLAMPARWALQRRCRRARAGLLVSTHRPTGLPTLLHTAPDLDVLTAIVNQLTGGDFSVITPEDVARAYLVRGHDVRETLFDLYSLYERRRRHDR
ncbi:MAG: hypothetical protein WDZ59_14210 [Pirellulales bacterium]